MANAWCACPALFRQILSADPLSVEALMGYEAVQLFVNRAGGACQFWFAGGECKCCG